MMPPQNLQYMQQYLSTILSQRGLPYSEDLKWHIRNQLVSLASEFPSLNPKTATYTHTDGRSVTLLQADGTVPIHFQNNTYNIPIVLWLLDSFPTHPPLVYVNPTRDMLIKRPHPFVNPSGAVSVPYLHSWIFPASNLVQLARELSECFARDPPLYSQRRNPPSNPSPVQNPNPSFEVLRPAARLGSYPPSPYGSNSGFGNARVEDHAEVFKRNAITKIVEMVHGDVEGLRKGQEMEMDGMFGAQSVLRERGEMLGRGVREMQAEKEALEGKLQMVLMNGDVLEGWVRENEGKVAKMREVEVDDAFEPMDGLSRQMLDCTAADLAIEDTIYSLDKAVQEEVVPFEHYLRSIRMLSRKQFFHRALAAKVKSAQMQTQIGNMAARVQHHAT